MDTILIGKDKIKIILESADMARYSLESDFRCADEKTRRAFFRIIDEAGKKTGFDPSHCRLLLQLFPSREGGCELFVTRVGEKAGDIKGLTGSKESGVDMKLTEVMRLTGYNELIYRFESVSLLLEACRRLRQCGYSGQSGAYAEKGGDACFLCLHPFQNCGDHAAELACEYGTPEFFSHAGAYITEHCAVIAQKDAVPLLGKLAN